MQIWIFRHWSEVLILLQSKYLFLWLLVKVAEYSSNTHTQKTRSTHKMVWNGFMCDHPIWYFARSVVRKCANIRGFVEGSSREKSLYMHASIVRPSGCLSFYCNSRALVLAICCDLVQRRPAVNHCRHCLLLYTAFDWKTLFHY